MAFGALAQAVVNTYTNLSGVQASATAQYGSNTTSGNLLVLVLEAFSDITFTAVSTPGNTFVQFPGSKQFDSLTGASVEVWYAQNCVGETTPTVTVTVPGTGGRTVAMTILECPGGNLTAAVDWASGANGTGTAVSVGMTTNLNNLLYIGAVAVGNQAVAMTQTAGWTSTYSAVADSHASVSVQRTGDGATLAAGAYAATWTLGSSQNWAAVLVAFAPAGITGRGGVASVYVDATLSADILNGNYSIAGRNGSGFDGNATKTLVSGITNVPSGGTIKIRAGQIAEGTSGAIYNITKPMTIQPYAPGGVGELVTVTYGAGYNPVAPNIGQIFTINSSSVTIDGFLQVVNGVKTQGLTILGTRVLGDNIVAGIDTDTDSNIEIGNFGATTIRRCEITGFGHCGIKAGGSVSGALTIEYNYIHSGGFTNRDHDIYAHAAENFTKIIRYNWLDDTAGFGVHCYAGTSYWNVYQNIITRCRAGGILISGSNMQFVGNTIVGCAWVDVFNAIAGLVVFEAADTHLTIQNNVMWGNGSGDICAQGAFGASCIVQNNCWNTNNSGLGLLTNWTATATGDVSADPKLVNETSTADWMDCRVGPGSSCITAGVSAGAPYNQGFDPTNFTWPPTLLAQGASYDVGAFRYTGKSVGRVASSGRPTSSGRPISSGRLMSSGRLRV